MHVTELPEIKQRREEQHPYYNGNICLELNPLMRWYHPPPKISETTGRITMKFLPDVKLS